MITRIKESETHDNTPDKASSAGLNADVSANTKTTQELITFRLTHRNFSVVLCVIPSRGHTSVRRIFHDEPEFLNLATAGLETADIFIYDGHSGLGSYMNLSRFEKHLGRPLKLPLNKSQIFYFNGCSTFPYYNAVYFALKRTTEDPVGSRHLDIITTSVGATFDVGARHDAAFLGGLLLGKYPTWQKILDEIYEVDPVESTLSHVNGDEDNPTASPGI